MLPDGATRARLQRLESMQPSDGQGVGIAYQNELLGRIAARQVLTEAVAANCE